MPEEMSGGVAQARSSVSAFLGRVQLRLRCIIALRAVATGAVATASVLVIGRFVSWPAGIVAAAALVTGGLVSTCVLALAWRRSGSGEVARLVEWQTRSLDNLLIAAEELTAKLRPVAAPLVDEVFRQAAARVQQLRPADVAPLRTPALVAVLLLSAAAVTWLAPARSRPPGTFADGTEVAEGAAATGIASVVVRVLPPSYAQMPERSLSDPPEVRLLEGSRVEVTVDAPGASAVDLVSPDGRAVRLETVGGRHTTSLVARETAFVLLRPEGTSPASPRLLSLIVEPDERPAIRIREPARDLAFVQPAGRIPMQVEASDDVALTEVQLRYTHVTGTGETFTFKEGTLPLTIDRVDRAHWTANGALTLESLGMEIGDTLVYRAIARDGKPGADPVASESFIVEIGAVAGATSAGFALPDDRERQAISQQMVIVKTERLEAARASLGSAEFAEQARMLAVEQRMVRAEFVFMTGGEVQDEEEEAAHSHDLVEGRFENEGQVELLTAIREMSRAEAALNGADTRNALRFERAALAALQRAFDRRRYFLRTLPERTRIDLSRRLTGERAEARSWTRERSRVSLPEDVERMADLMRALAAGARAPEAADVAQLAARLGSIAPADPDMQTAAVALGRASTAEQKTEAMRAAMQLLASRAARLLSPSASLTVPAEAVEGRFAAEIGSVGKGDRR